MPWRPPGPSDDGVRHDDIECLGSGARANSQRELRLGNGVGPGRYGWMSGLWGRARERREYGGRASLRSRQIGRPSHDPRKCGSVLLLQCAGHLLRTGLRWLLGITAQESGAAERDSGSRRDHRNYTGYAHSVPVQMPPGQP